MTRHKQMDTRIPKPYPSRERLNSLKVQTFGLKISRMAYARINRRADSESVFLYEFVLLKFGLILYLYVVLINIRLALYIPTLEK